MAGMLNNQLGRQSELNPGSEGPGEAAEQGAAAVIRPWVRWEGGYEEDPHARRWFALAVYATVACGVHAPCSQSLDESPQGKSLASSGVRLLLP